MKRWRATSYRRRRRLLLLQVEWILFFLGTIISIIPTTVESYTYYDKDTQIRTTVIDLALRFTPFPVGQLIGDNSNGNGVVVDEDDDDTNWSKDNFITSIRIFLDENLNTIPTIRLHNLHVALGKQQAVNYVNQEQDKESSSSSSSSILTSNSNNNNGSTGSISSSITAEIQILLEYKILPYEQQQLVGTTTADVPPASTTTSNGDGSIHMEGQIVSLFLDQWEELLEYLKLFDRDQFNNVDLIELGVSDLSHLDDTTTTKNNNGNDSSPPTTTIPSPGDDSSSNSLNYNPSFSGILILIIVGVGLLVSIITATPLFCKRPRRPNNSRRRNHR